MNPFGFPQENGEMYYVNDIPVIAVSCGCTDCSFIFLFEIDDEEELGDNPSINLEYVFRHPKSFILLLDHTAILNKTWELEDVNLSEFKRKIHNHFNYRSCEWMFALYFHIINKSPVGEEFAEFN